MVKLQFYWRHSTVLKVIGGYPMPLREVNRIEAMAEMYINYTMKNDYRINPGDRVVMEVKRHFNPRGGLKQNINRTYEIELSSSRWISLPRDLPELNEHGVSHEDYLEVVYTHLRRAGEDVEIYPGEVREYLDFDPDRVE